MIEAMCATGLLIMMVLTGLTIELLRTFRAWMDVVVVERQEMAFTRVTGTYQKPGKR